ncbi:hypothetical protein [Catenuloplanes japonicus]|uniref:hypothetical protein n=1 Tax=Catenuloplanes japonicus TaxID=33876 RepID=UPI0012F84147|nr:hypothetical protein [Catenuloplanes japonicus]
MSKKLLGGAFVCAMLATGALHATPASAAPADRGCGADQSDWVVQKYGYTGDVDVTTAYGEEPAGSHQRFLDLLPQWEVAVRTAENDAFEGDATFAGDEAKIWKRGYTWTVPATTWSPGGTASFLGPECKAGTTIVESAIYLFEAWDSYDDGAKTAWGVLTRDI